jgi:hypothetical protein
MLQKYLWYNLHNYWHNPNQNIRKYSSSGVNDTVKRFIKLTLVAKVKKLFSYLNHNKNKLSQIKKNTKSGINHMGKRLIILTPVANVINLFWHNFSHSLR